MKISDISEFGFIERLSASFKELLPKGVKGIGDDCALFPKNSDEFYMVSADMLVEDRHFFKNKILPYQLGFKSLAVNLSDIAAMGGTPLASFLSIGLPAETSLEWLDKFVSGYKELSVKENVPLCGGDTVASPIITISVTVIGEAEAAAVRLRSMAKPGDIICCTSNLGDSGAGFLALSSGIGALSDEQFLLKRHYEPYPEISAGKWLGRTKGIGAMIDISDGLLSDLFHIIKESGVSAFLNLQDIPISQELKRSADRHGWNSLELALNGGEDYCLLLTVSRDNFKNVSEEFLKTFARPLFAIGEIEDGDGKIRFLRDGKEVDLPGKPFSHFG